MHQYVGVWTPPRLFVAKMLGIFEIFSEFVCLFVFVLFCFVFFFNSVLSCSAGFQRELTTGGRHKGEALKVNIIVLVLGGWQ